MPNIKKIAEGLTQKYLEAAHERWCNYVAATLSLHTIYLNAPLFIEKDTSLVRCTHEEVRDFKYDYDDQQDILNRGSPFKLDKKDFGWGIFREFFSDGHSPVHAVQNAKEQYKHYIRLAELAKRIEGTEDLETISSLIAQIKRTDTTVPSILPPPNGGQPHQIFIQEGQSPNTGSNFIEDFFRGVFTVLATPILAISSILYGIGSILLLNKTYYFGSLTFLKDMLCECIMGLVNITATVIFPVSMLYSKATTGSFNIFKGERLRALDSLKEICQEAANSSEQQIFA